jgi:dTDP-4-amino-4,6-dideoxygalactose transaminase
MQLKQNYEFGSRCLALSSGTAAIHLGLEILGRGDEVLLSKFHIFSPANPILSRS